MKHYIPRYWSQMEVTVPVDVHGFLIDDLTIMGRTQRQGLRKIAAIPERVSVLLGGSGEGKSTDFEYLERHADGSYVHRIDLLRYTKEAIDNGNLARSVVESDGYVKAQEQNQPVILLIDSFDECVYVDRKLVFSIASQLKSLVRPIDSVRIASRPDDLTNLLLDSLREEFGSKAVSVYCIAPLSRGDVIAYAKSHDVDFDSFMHYVVDNDLAEFAANPQLLTFLAEAFISARSVAKGRASLYRLHLLKLLETSHRAISSKVTTLTIDEILNIAGRCALATVFSGRNIISESPSVREGSEDIISFDELMYNPRRDDPQVPSLRKSTLEELFSTPLFRMHIDGRVEWHHRSYAEYLAAVALSKSKLQPAQIVGLFTTTVLGELGVPSQLFQCASFLVELRPDLHEEFLELEPEIFLVADISHLSDAQKARIVERVLQQYENGKSYDRIDLRRRYRRLAHASLATQLKPRVSGGALNSVARRVAIDVAQECHVFDLLPLLFEVAINIDERLQDRVNAVHAIVHLGEADYVKKLRCLLSVQENEDPDCELRGSALLGLWPSYMEVDELATALTSIRVPHLFGSYFRFVRYHLPETVRDEDLPTLLSVSNVLLEQVDTLHYYEELMLVTVSRSLNLVETREEMCSMLANFILESAHTGKSILRLSAIGTSEALRQQIVQRIHGDSDLRRAILLKVSEQVVNARRQVAELHSEYDCIVSTDDMDWYIDQLTATLSQMQRAYYCSLIEAVAHWNDAVNADRVLTAAYRHHELFDLLQNWILPVDLDSEKADQMRQWASSARGVHLEQVNEGDQVYLRSLRETVESVTLGDGDKWIRVCEAMSINIDTGVYDRIWDPNMTHSKLWPMLDQDEQGRVCDIAMAYLEEHHLSDEPTPRSGITVESVAAYKAFVLLFLQRESEILLFGSDHYRRWMQSVMYYPTGYGTGDDEMHAQIISLAYKICPIEVRDTFMTLLQYEVSRIREKGADKLRDPMEALLFVQHKMTYCWDVDIENVLMDIVYEHSDLPEILPSLLCFMLEHDSDAAARYVRDVLESGESVGGVDKRRWIACAVEAMTFAKKEEWDLLWSTLLKHTELSKEAFLDYVYKERYSSNNLVERLTESQQANLYIWLEKQYPHDTDPIHKGARMVSARDMIGEYRDRILKVLKDRGTADAVHEIERIQREYPEHQWLNYTLVDARRKAHEITWSPIEPSNLFELLTDEESRLVRSEQDLCDVIVESLDRLSDRLQGHTPMAEFLWNTENDKKYTPKNETALSNYIKDHLETDLLGQSKIIVNREVSIGPQGHRGKKTDIHVDCLVAADNTARIKAVIEVKCCWNRELISAMESQLAGQYLNDTDCRVGVYMKGATLSVQLQV